MSQIGLALPTIILYEISIWLVQRIERTRARADANRKASGTETAGTDPAE